MAKNYIDSYHYRLRLFGEHRHEFQAVFGFNLRQCYDNLTGFDTIKLSDLLQVPDDQSTEDFIREKHGERAVQLCRELMGTP